MALGSGSNSIKILLQLVADTQQAITNLNLTINVINNINNASNNASTGVNNMSGSLTAAVLAGHLAHDALRELTDIIKTAVIDTTLFAGRTEELQIALYAMAKANNISKQEIDGYVTSLRGQKISQQESIQILTQMIGANQDLSKASQLARVAQDLAVVSGKNSSETFQQLNQAMLLQNTESLRSVGIFLNLTEVWKKGAAQLGISKEALTQVQKQQILQNAVIEYGTRLTGTYEAAMGSASKQMRSMQRVADDAKTSIGNLFQGPFAVAITLTTELLEIIAKYPGAVALVTVSLTAMTAAFVLLGTSALPALLAQLSSFLTLGRTLIFLMTNIQLAAAMTTAELIAATAGFAAIGIAIGAVIVYMNSYESAAEKANKITIDQIDALKKNLDKQKELAAAAKEVADAQEGSAIQHQKLNDILGFLDPKTRVYIEALKDQTEKIKALNEEMEKGIELAKSKLEAELRVTGAGIIDLQNQKAKLNADIQLAQDRIDAIRRDPALAISIGKSIQELSTTITEITPKVEEISSKLAENERKLKVTATYLKLDAESLKGFFFEAGQTTEEVNRLANAFTQKVTPALKKHVEAQEAAEDAAKKESSRMKTRTEELKNAADAAAQNEKVANEKIKAELERGVINQRKATADTIAAARERALADITVARGRTALLEQSPLGGDTQEQRDAELKASKLAERKILDDFNQTERQENQKLRDWEKKQADAANAAILTTTKATSEARIEVLRAEIEENTDLRVKNTELIIAEEKSISNAEIAEIQRRLNAAGKESDERLNFERELTQAKQAANNQEARNLRLLNAARLQSALDLAHKLENLPLSAAVDANTIAKIQDHIEQRIVTEEAGQEEIGKIVVAGVQREIDSLKLEIKARTDAKQDVSQLNKQLAVLEQKKVDAQDDANRKTAKGRQNDIDNERLYVRSIIELRESLNAKLLTFQIRRLQIAQEELRKRGVFDRDLLDQEMIAQQMREDQIHANNEKEIKNKIESLRTKQNLDANDLELLKLLDAELELERERHGQAEYDITQEWMDRIEQLQSAQSKGLYLGLDSGQLASASKNLSDFTNTATIGLSAVGAVVHGLAQGFGQLLQNILLTGKLGPKELQKLTASVLAQVAAQAAVMAIMELAYGFAALTPWGAALYGPAPFHFKAAAMFGAVAFITGLGARAIAGGAFSDSQGATPVGGSSGASSSGSTDKGPTTINVPRNDAPQRVIHEHVFSLKDGLVVQHIEHAVHTNDQRFDAALRKANNNNRV